MTKQRNQTLSWKESFQAYRKPEAIRMFFLGFSAGLPLLLTASTFSLWLSVAETTLGAIGYSSLIGIAYAYKWVWAPLVDRSSIPFLTSLLGRRRSWMLLSQIFIIIGLFGMAFVDPQKGLAWMMGFAIVVAFSSATQDIALDAYRIESAQSNQQSTLIATYSAGYRLAMVWAGAGALFIVGYLSAQNPNSQASSYSVYAWQVAYIVMSLSMLVGILTVIFSPEPEQSKVVAQEIKEEAKQQQSLPLGRRMHVWLRAAVLVPFADFLTRYQQQAMVILALIAVYRISDMVMGAMTMPFYHAMGYSVNEIAFVTKIFGPIVVLLGTFLGGLLVARFGIFKVLLLGAILSAATNLLFALLGIGINQVDILGLQFETRFFQIEASGRLVALTVIISLDNLSSGIATAAFLGYLSSLTNVKFSATQYALFSSLMQLIPAFLKGFSGEFVELTSFPTFFMCTALVGIPVIFLVLYAQKLSKRNADTPENPDQMN